MKSQSRHQSIYQPIYQHFVAFGLAAVMLFGCSATQEVGMEEPQTGTPGAGDGAGGTQTARYPESAAATAEQLYGAEPGTTSEAYRQAMERNEALRYNIIYFEYNSSVVNDDGRDALSHHAAFMQDNPGVTLRLEGHADERGSAGYNLALGEQRAKSVRSILQAGGVEAVRVSVISYGEERPAVDGYTEDAYSRNRRAELIYQ